FQEKIEESGSWRWASGRSKRLSLLFRRLLECLPALKKFSCEVTVDSELPMGVGFGSSAALCVALVRASYALIGERPENQAVWELAHRLEGVFHGAPSGIDTGIAVFEELCFFERREGGRGEGLPVVECVRGVGELPLVIGAVPRESTTRRLVSDLKARLEGDTEAAEWLKELGAEAKGAKGKLGDLEALGALFNRAQCALEKLIPMPKGMVTMLDCAGTAGALGVKMSGAGGGGAYIALARSPKAAERLAEEMRAFAEAQRIPHALLPVAYVHEPAAEILSSIK
ncbi:MAG: hypothetical protein KDK40_05545, partial [Chlamydiia bacterium]|nr:hypothetical protein [Chlamydiia bacterium]